MVGVPRSHKIYSCSPRKGRARRCEQLGEEARKRAQEAEQRATDADAEAWQERERQRHADIKAWQEREKQRRANTGGTPAFGTRRRNAQVNDSDTAAIKAWRDAVDAAFADYANMTAFPEPPALGVCRRAGCAQGERTLKACACQVERAFSLAKVDLKTERLRWHSDKFGRHIHRDQMMAKATEVFQVVNRMFEAQQ